MYQVIDNTGFVRGAFDSLDTAMQAAKLVDEFVGAQPESNVKSWLDKNLK